MVQNKCRKPHHRHLQMKEHQELQNTETTDGHQWGCFGRPFNSNSQEDSLSYIHTDLSAFLILSTALLLPWTKRMQGQQVGMREDKPRYLWHKDQTCKQEKYHRRHSYLLQSPFPFLREQEGWQPLQLTHRCQEMILLPSKKKQGKTISFLPCGSC